MNSIRHVLSTTVVFRKVVRDRTQGRTQWAIWDDDLECFKGGGFRKQFCKDAVGDAAVTAAKEKEKELEEYRATVGTSTAKPTKRARNPKEEGGEEPPSRKNKRSKKDKNASNEPPVVQKGEDGSALTLQPAPQPFLPSGSTNARHSSHHQPYYQSAAATPAPPVGTYRMIANAGWSPSTSSPIKYEEINGEEPLSASRSSVAPSQSHSQDHDTPMDMEDSDSEGEPQVNTSSPSYSRHSHSFAGGLPPKPRTRPHAPSLGSSTSSMSFLSSIADMPELTPNRSSSIPSSPAPETSDVDLPVYGLNGTLGPSFSSVDKDHKNAGYGSMTSFDSDEDEDDTQPLRAKDPRSKLTPVKSWQKSSPGGKKPSEAFFFEGGGVMSSKAKGVAPAPNGRKFVQGRGGKRNDKQYDEDEEMMSASDVPVGHDGDQGDQLEETDQSESADDDEKDVYKPKPSKKKKKAPVVAQMVRPYCKSLPVLTILSKIPFDLPPSPTPNRRSTRLVIKHSLTEISGGSDNITGPSSSSQPTSHKYTNSSASSSRKGKGKANNSFRPLKVEHLSSPSPCPPGGAAPSTPPRHARGSKATLLGLTLSPVHTPLSHRGLHMSPAPADLAHYKSHLDPPPPAVNNLDRNDDEDSDQEETDANDELPVTSLVPDTQGLLSANVILSQGEERDPFRTPSRKKDDKAAFAAPSTGGMFTPRKLIFPFPAPSSLGTPSRGLNLPGLESPLGGINHFFRTPGGPSSSSLSGSPFRGIPIPGMDGYDGLSSLNEELEIKERGKSGLGYGELSPMFRKGLYESPVSRERLEPGAGLLDSPSGRHSKRWWEA
jgi:hypothetical protein